MTGYLVRIKRDGEWFNPDIAELSDDELTELSQRLPDDGWRWAIALAKWIRDNCKSAGTGESNSWGDQYRRMIRQSVAALSEKGERPARCPTCYSPSAEMHPAVQHEGEVEICKDAWHQGKK